MHGGTFEASDQGGDPEALTNKQKNIARRIFETKLQEEPAGEMRSLTLYHSVYTLI